MIFEPKYPRLTQELLVRKLYLTQKASSSSTGIEPSELLKYIRKLNLSKSVGLDKISNKILKACALLVSFVLSKIFD